MDKTVFLMLCGLPGSGKSKYAKEMTNYTVFSSDSLRKELWGSEEQQGDNSIIFNELQRRIKLSLLKGQNCILDATNLNSKKRKNFLKQLRLDNSVEKDCIVVATAIVKCIDNNQKREKNVPEDVIFRMYEQFEFPVYSEGWDGIGVTFPFNLEGHESERIDLQEMIDELYDYDQGNKNHSLSLGEHLEKCSELWKMRHNGTYSYAGILHDIGKPQTRTEIKANGTVDGDSHYYNHQNTSAYESMFWLESCGAFNIETVQLIQMHMLPYFNKDEETIRRKAGDLFELVMDLHDCDKKAH